MLTAVVMCCMCALTSQTLRPTLAELQHEADQCGGLHASTIHCIVPTGHMHERTATSFASSSPFVSLVNAGRVRIACKLAVATASKSVLPPFNKA